MSKETQPPAPPAGATTTTFKPASQPTPASQVIVKQAPVAEGGIAALQKKIDAKAAASKPPPIPPPEGVKEPVTPDPIAADPAAPADPAASASPEFVANFKYKSYDKDFEVQDEFFKNLIKDADSQKKIIDLHERASGFGELKERHTKLRDDHKALSDKHSALDFDLKQLGEMVKDRDMGSFFHTLNIPFEVVADFVRQEFVKREAAPDQRAIIEEQERVRRENRELRQKNETLSSQSSSQTLQAKEFELQSALSRPEVVAFSQLFEAKLGKDSFRKAVLERGQLAFNMTGQNIPFDQAIQQAMLMYAPFISPAQPGATNNSAPTPPPPASAASATPAPKAPPAVIPNVSGGSNSPIKKGYTRIAQLKERAKEIGRTGS